MTVSTPGLVSGTTTLVGMIGHPVRQVHMPGFINARFRDRGMDAVMVPMDIAPAALASFVDVLRGAANMRGTVVTLPHKAAMAAHVDELTARAAELGAVNVVRREADGRLIGDMLDGEGMVLALGATHFRIAGQTCWVIGAGAAGSAIALALCEAGACQVHVSDLDTERARSLAGRLAAAGHPMAAGEPADIGTVGIVVNASTAGMDGNGSPVAAGTMAGLSAKCGVADVVTRPAETPLLLAARARGLATVSGAAMAEAQTSLVARFLGLNID